MEIIKRNLFKQLRIDYFATDEAMDPMSNFKKGKLQRLVNNISLLTNGEVVMANPFLNKRLNKIILNERHAIDTSMVTVDLLKIIVSNVNATLNRGIPIYGIIELGQHLRTKGDKVDFVKLEQWLHSLRLLRMAQLQGSILIEFFDFEINEIPFVQFVEKDAFRLTIKSVTNTVADHEKEWNFRQGKAGFLQNNSAILRRNLRRSIRYAKYSPIEIVSNFISNFARSLSEIEE